MREGSPAAEGLACQRYVDHRYIARHESIHFAKPTFLILAALAPQPLHGYAIIGEVGELSGGRLALRPGTLYGALDRLADEGLLESDREEVVNGRLRRYYRLTDDGAAVLEREAARLQRNADAARGRLARRQAHRHPARAESAWAKSARARQPGAGLRLAGGWLSLERRYRRLLRAYPATTGPSAARRSSGPTALARARLAGPARDADADRPGENSGRPGRAAGRGWPRPGLRAVVEFLLRWTRDPAALDAAAEVVTLDVLPDRGGGGYSGDHRDKIARRRLAPRGLSPRRARRGGLSGT